MIDINLLARFFTILQSSLLMIKINYEMGALNPGKIPRQLGIDRPDLVLEANMGFQIEPNAAFEKTFINTGANVLLHEDGPEELNPIAGVMHVVEV